MYGYTRVLQGLTPSVATRRSSDLRVWDVGHGQLDTAPDGWLHVFERDANPGDLISHIAIEPTLVEECRLCRIGGLGKGGVNVGLDRQPSRQGRQIVDPEETRLDGFETRFGNGVFSTVGQEKNFVKVADVGGIA